MDNSRVQHTLPYDSLISQDLMYNNMGLSHIYFQQIKHVVTKITFNISQSLPLLIQNLIWVGRNYISMDRDYTLHYSANLNHFMANSKNRCQFRIQRVISIFNPKGCFWPFLYLHMMGLDFGVVVVKTYLNMSY